MRQTKAPARQQLLSLPDLKWRSPFNRENLWGRHLGKITTHPRVCRNLTPHVLGWYEHCCRNGHSVQRGFLAAQIAAPV